ncbi:hypothetical protein AK812_SmicGene1917 [Symbiodinium microadriaticum]|uniref:Uncharacterized protein n=1 Tax=Symbiodinium microadriaticum TaxID=2951 RepID=A0A1Q9F2V5_SYMMI|nr:hypothetical protein AK812_SmicGene1917 [Symbiodinium microadriaticum]
MAKQAMKVMKAMKAMKAKAKKTMKATKVAKRPACSSVAKRPAGKKDDDMSKKDDDRKKDDDKEDRYERELRLTDFGRYYERVLKEQRLAEHAGEKDDDKSSDDDKKKDDGFEWTMEDLLPRGSDDHEKKDDDKRPDDDKKKDDDRNMPGSSGDVYDDKKKDDDTGKDDDEISVYTPPGALDFAFGAIGLDLTVHRVLTVQDAHGTEAEVATLNATSAGPAEKPPSRQVAGLNTSGDDGCPVARIQLAMTKAMQPDIHDVFDLRCHFEIGFLHGHFQIGFFFMVRLVRSRFLDGFRVQKQTAALGF